MYGYGNKTSATPRLHFRLDLSAYQNPFADHPGFEINLEWLFERYPSFAPCGVVAGDPLADPDGCAGDGSEAQIQHKREK